LLPYLSFYSNSQYGNDNVARGRETTSELRCSKRRVSTLFPLGTPARSWETVEYPDRHRCLPYLFRRWVLLCFYLSFRTSRSFILHLNGWLSRKSLPNTLTGTSSQYLPGFSPFYRELYKFHTENCWSFLRIMLDYSLQIYCPDLQRLPEPYPRWQW